MTFLSWAALHEGPTDDAYFGILIPSLMEDIVCRRGNRNVTVPQSPAVSLGKSGRAVKDVAAEVCRERSAFDLFFLHADTGGRALEATLDERSTAYKNAIFELCSFSNTRCIVIAPRHETEAWLLADRDAIGEALGFRGDLESFGLPADAIEAEGLADPKAVLNNAINGIRGRRRQLNVSQMIVSIAQNQNLDRLRRFSSFCQFEQQLIDALKDMRCID